MKKNLLYILLFGLTTTLSGCFTRPSYPNAPSISLKDIQFIEGKNFQQDTIALYINFRDGDGNLGLAASDTSGVFARKRNGVYNPDYFNITVDCFQRKANGQIDSIPMPSLSNIDGTFYGRFPRIRPEKSGPVEGFIRYDLKSFFFFNGDVSQVSFKIQIKDRSLNKSERIQTPFIQIK